MMTQQHERITGYRSLSDQEIELLNESKALAVKAGELVDKLKAHGVVDQRWVAIGATDLQKGFMSLARAIAKPTTF